MCIARMPPTCPPASYLPASYLPSCAQGDLMRAWDRSGDGELSRDEFEAEVHNYFSDQDPELWDLEVQPVVLESVTPSHACSRLLTPSHAFALLLTGTASRLGSF